MRFLYNRLGWLALVSFASLAQGCINKGDTTINSEASKSRKPMVEDSGVTSATADTGETMSPTSASDTTQPSDTEPTDTKPANTGSGTPSASSVSTDVTTSATEPSTSPSDTSDETTSDGAGGAGETEGPPKEPVACTPGATPTRGEVVQLSDSRDFKQGLKLVQGDDGYLLAWQTKNGTKLEVSYQVFEADFSPRFEAMTLPDVENLGGSGLAITWVPSSGQFALAFDQSSFARITLIDAADGAASLPEDSELPTTGSPLLLAYARPEGLLHVSTLLATGSCPSVGTIFESRFFDLLTGTSTTPMGPMCQLSQLAVFDDPEQGTCIALNGGGQMPLVSVACLNPDDPSTPSSSLTLDAKLNPSGGGVAGLDGEGKLVVVTQVPAGGQLYARINKESGEIIQSSEIAATGAPHGLAVAGDAVGVLVEDAATARFFARSGDDGSSVHPVGVVAAQKGLHDALLATRGEHFAVFFLAPDDDGDPQLFGSEISCAAE